MTKQLYYGSLEQHMRQYIKDVKLNQLNNDYQLAQQAIVKEGEAMQLSRAEIQNKIEMMKQTLKDNIAKKLLHKEPLQTVDQDTQIKREVKNIMNSMLSGLEKKNNMLSELEIKNTRLKPIPSRPIKVKKLSPFQQELTQKLDERTRLKKILPEQLSMSNITTEETKARAKAKAGRKKPIASIVSDATTASDSTTVNPSGSPRVDPIDPIEQKTTGDNMIIKKEIVDRYKTLNMDVPKELTKRGGVKDEILTEHTKILNGLESERMAASGLRKRKSKKK